MFRLVLFIGRGKVALEKGYKQVSKFFYPNCISLILRGILDKISYLTLQIHGIFLLIKSQFSVVDLAAVVIFVVVVVTFLYYSKAICFLCVFVRLFNFFHSNGLIISKIMPRICDTI